MRNYFQGWVSRIVPILVLVIACVRATAADTLSWNTNQNSVTADIHSLPVVNVLEGVAQRTGWHVFLEETATHNVSTKFQDLSPGEALRMLLGDLNFAVVPKTNGPSDLYVFRTSQGNARRRIQPSELVSKLNRSGKIPNELIVTLKPGVKIDGLGCLGNANVTGRMESLNVYRVQFKDAAAAQSARDCLAKNPDVLSVEDNYSMEPPDPSRAVSNPSSDINLNPKATEGCQVIIGLIDTRVGSLGKNLDQFMMPAISVAGEGCSSSQLTHGKSMAETIFQGVQANSHGSTSVKILPVDVYGCNESTSTFDVAAGVSQAVSAGANVINMSLAGTGDSPLLHKLIQNTASQGVIFFGAAGNQPVTTPMFPAAYPEVTAVTAASGPGEVADYANRGSFVDLMLPGTSIVPYNGQSYAVSGTSTATAFASGIAAGLADFSHNCPGQVIPTMQSKFGVKLDNSQP